MALLPNNLTPFQKFSREGSGLIFAEAGSMIVSLGAVGYADKIAPKMVSELTDKIAKKIIEPHLESFEKWGETLCHVKDCKSDKTQSREDRAKKIARAAVVFAPALAAGVLTKVAIRRGANEKFGMPYEHSWWKLHKLSEHDFKIFAIDDGVHIGGVVFLNTIGSGIADKMISGATNILHDVFGMEKKRAHDMASMGVLYEVVPNGVGMMAALAAIGHRHYRK